MQVLARRKFSTDMGLLTLAMKKRYHTVNGMLIGETSNGVRRGYLPDALGSVVATVDNNGAIENTYRYKPYGSLLAKTGTALDPRFMWVGTAGYRTTQGSLLPIAIRLRHYLPVTARWTSQDPCWSCSFLRRFVYARCNPVTLTDPSGLRESEPCAPAYHEWPPCNNPRAFEKCADAVISDRCPNGTWHICDGPQTFKIKCKHSEATCNDIRNRVKDIDDVITGVAPDDTQSGQVWFAATGCCTKPGGFGFFTVCCSSGPLGRPPTMNPCLAYCVLGAHEAGAHGEQCKNRDGLGSGGPGNEIAALICERNCLAQVYVGLGCKPDLPPPPRTSSQCPLEGKKWWP